MTMVVSGHIVNVPKNQAAYNSSKAGSSCFLATYLTPPHLPILIVTPGVIHLCKSLAVEWRNFARVNTVSPGFTNTGLSSEPEAAPVLDHAYKTTPLGRMADPRELKGVCLRALIMLL
jgi:sorbose reductase